MTAKKTNPKTEFASHGVENLIQQLRQEGVDRGRSEADAILADARKKAARIVADAEAQARQIVAEARTEAKSLETAGQDALQLAARDAHLKLRDNINQRFSDEVHRLVGQIMKPDEFLAKLILQVAARAVGDAGISETDELTIKLPEDVIAIEDLRENPEELRQGTLSHVVVSVMAGLLEKGISYQPSGDISGGITACLKDGEIEVDLSDEAISAVLLEHLQPRFRALLDGVVR